MDINVKMGCVWNVEYKYYHSTAFNIIVFNKALGVPCPINVPVFIVAYH